MYNSKLIRLIKLLDKQDIREFIVFLKSPFFNRTNRLVDLFYFVKENFQDSNNQNLSREKLINRFYSEYVDGVSRLKKDQSALVKLLKQYLTISEIGEDERNESRLFLKALEKRSFIHFKRESEILIKKQKNCNTPDLEDFRIRHELNLELFFHPESDKFQIGNEYLENALDSLDQYYALSKFRISSEMKHRRKFLNIPSKHSRFSEQRSAKEMNNNKVFQIYQMLFDLLEKDEPIDTFILTKTKLENQINQISDYDKKNIISKLIYIASRYYEKKYIYYLNHIYDLFKLAHENKFLLVQGKISPILFVNIAAVSSAIDARNRIPLDWAKNFLTAYEDYIDERYKDTTIKLAWAYLNFCEHQFGKVERVLINLSKEHFADYLQIETLNLRNYYEQYRLNGIDRVEKIEKCLNRLKKYMKEKGITSKNKTKAVINFLNLFNGLYKALLEKDHQKKVKIKEKLKDVYKDSKYVFGAMWISEKISQL